MIAKKIITAHIAKCDHPGCRRKIGAESNLEQPEFEVLFKIHGWTHHRGSNGLKTYCRKHNPDQPIPTRSDTCINCLKTRVKLDERGLCRKCGKGHSRTISDFLDGGFVQYRVQESQRAWIADLCYQSGECPDKYMKEAAAVWLMENRPKTEGDG